MKSLRPVRRLAGVVALVLLLAAVLVVVRSDGSRPAGPAWVSGVSGDGAADGAFASWRGRPVAIIGTWNDNAESQVPQWTVAKGTPLARYRGDVDDAVGAIYRDRGESWSAAAQGAYDDRWREMLTNLAHLWRHRDGTLYLRFAHEFNGEWEPWSVSADQVSDFKAAWRRFRSLQRSILPEAELVFCPTSQTSSSLGLDWRKAFPGRSQVDVVSVDYYNQFPVRTTARGFTRSLVATDDEGAPRGLEGFRRFARAEGLPFAVSEWSSNAEQADSPAFMAGFHRWLERHAGSGPGQVIYEIVYNVSAQDGVFHLSPDTEQPQAAAAYRRLW